MADEPKVFISHASEDKARFVLEFATRVRACGIDAWLDKWEMLPGDSLVDKIFEQGIKDASAFIVVLSNTSVQKKWVREEMNAAFVARVSRQCKIIPIVIDQCEVPEALKSTLWERITDLTDYDENLKRIVASIFGVSSKPPIGSAPSFVTADKGEFAPDLEPTDAAVLWRLGDVAIAGEDDFVGNLELLDQLEGDGIAGSDIVDALEVLNERGYIEASKVLGGGYRGSGISHVQLTLFGLDVVLRAKFPAFDDIAKQIAAKIVNEDILQSGPLFTSVEYPKLLVEHIVDVFDHQCMLKVSKHFGGFFVHNVSPSLKRYIR